MKKLHMFRLFALFGLVGLLGLFFDDPIWFAFFGFFAFFALPQKPVGKDQAESQAPAP